MATDTTLDLLAPVHRLSVAQYQQMARAGLFEGDVRVELIDGVLVEMSPTGSEHATAVIWLTRTLDRQLDDVTFISVQNPIIIRAHRSMPEPDLAIVSVADPQVGVLERPQLLIEVSDSSLGYDRMTKARLYARRVAAEYWIVNLRERVVEVHAGPDGDTWRRRTTLGPGATLRTEGPPGVEIDIAALFAFVDEYAGPEA